MPPYPWFTILLKVMFYYWWGDAPPAYPPDDWLNVLLQSGLTPLHVASFMGCMNIVIYLLQHSAIADVPTVRGETPLHLAARANQTDIIRILLRNGAQVDARARVSVNIYRVASFCFFRITVYTLNVLTLSSVNLVSRWVFSGVCCEVKLRLNHSFCQWILHSSHL